MRKIGTTAAVLVTAGAWLAGTAGIAGAATGPADQAVSATACQASWNSNTKSAEDATTKSLRNVTTGKHTCYDRMVFDVRGTTSKIGYHVGYVTKFRQNGTGDEIRVKGGAILEIVVNSPSYNPSNPAQKTYAGEPGKSLPGVDVTGYKTFRDTKFGTSFEGQTQVGLGLRAKLPFRVQQSGDKLIVDVAHAK
ncbi:AMIN-like domain-containing (lipo)protein [Streptomyces milbemycinicus]|uniref:AMIN-like domain-containing protein n=1 Tax=Streptomyces milbemycinicus TaxID=476552 RepID=A0ABW8LWH5_9ACTN